MKEIFVSNAVIIQMSSRNIVEIKGIVEIPFLHRLESLEMVALSVINDAECLGRMFS